MKRSTTSLILFGVFLLVCVPEVLSQDVSYNCKRSNSPCASISDICHSDGTCLCANPDRGGYDCSLDNTLLAADEDDCDPVCEDGLCLKNNTCYCHQNSTGDRCEEDRVAVECYPDGMDITIIPNTGQRGTFMGGLQVRGVDINTGSYNLSTCLKPHSDLNGSPLYFAFTECGGCFNTSTPEGEKLTFEVLVVYRLPLVQRTDLVYNVSCLLLGDNSPFNFVSEIAIPEGNDLIPRKSIEDFFNPLKLDIMNDKKEPIEEVVIGQMVTFNYIFTGEDLYPTWRLENVEAKGDHNDSIILLKNGCPNKASGVALTKKIVNKNLILKFPAFRFVLSSSLTFRSTAKFCRHSASCAQPICISKRRKRDVSSAQIDDSDVVYRELDATILVQFPSQETRGTGSSSPGRSVVTGPAEQSCRQSLALFILAIMLGCFLVLTTGGCLFFFIRTRKQDGVAEEKLVFNMDDKRSFS